jgi:hypothetical protein
VKKLVLPIVPTAQTDDFFFSRFFRTPTQKSLVIKVDGTGSIVRHPTQSSLNASLMYFLGGHENILTDTQVNAIVAAGFGEYIEET